jgi:hypothetical protein
LNPKIDLKLGFVTIQAARYACEKWHYSKKVPKGKQVFIGVWENSKFIGVVIFGRSAFPNIGRGLQLSDTKVVELTRIALSEHITPVSKILKIAIKIIRKANPDLKLLFSMADPNQKHVGIVYQASNWVYVGTGKKALSVVLPNNEVIHLRTAFHRYGKKWNKIPGSKIVTNPPKYKYVYILDKTMEKSILKLKKPYPKAD